MALDTTGLISVAEAARRLHRSEEQVRRNLRSGKLRGRRIGNQWFVEEREVEGAVADRLIPADLFAQVIELRKQVAPGLRGLDVVDLLREHRQDEEDR